MKKVLRFQCLLVLLLGLLPVFAQTIPSTDEEGIKGYTSLNDAHHPCISPQEYALLEKECRENISLLGLDKHIYRGTLTTSLDWPIRAAAGFMDCDYYFIGAYVDEDTTTGTIQDFACGTNTYDGHHGTDISAFPYGFYKLDHDQVEVIAAAAGTIIQKADGNFDRNCATNSLTANSIIIQHADGTEALYWHMKENSVTAKTVGQTVAAGEYLGVVGSSGNSTGPHLHFEVRTGSANNTYNDPFSGNCNSLNANSWWANQKPHTNSAVIKVSVNTTDIVLPGCPTTETPNESDTFAIPFQGPGLPAGYAKFYIFLRDDVTGMTADCKILNPNGSTFNSWVYTSTADNKAYIRGYSKVLPTTPGTYTFQATYNGTTCSKTFVIPYAVAVSDAHAASYIQIYPNPSKGKLFLKMDEVPQYGNKFSFIVFNSNGQMITQQDMYAEGKEIGLDLATGLYLYYLKDEMGTIVQSGKMVVE